MTKYLAPWIESLIGGDPAVDDAQERAKEAANQKAVAGEEANKLYIDYMNRALGVQERSMEEQKAASLAAMLMQLGLAGGADQTFRQMLNASQQQQLPYQTARVSALQSLPVLQAMAGLPAYRLPSDVSTVDFTSGRPDFRAIFESVAKLSNARTGSSGDLPTTPRDAAGNPIPDNIRAGVRNPPAQPAPTTPTTGVIPIKPIVQPQLSSALQGVLNQGLVMTQKPTLDTSGMYYARFEDPQNSAIFSMVPMTAADVRNFGYYTQDPQSGLVNVRTPPPTTPPTGGPQTPTGPTTTTTPTPDTSSADFDALIQEIPNSGVFPKDGGDLTTTATPLERFTPEYSYEDSPLYKFRKEEAEKASGRALRARGMYGSETGALITAREQERIAAEEAENQYRRVADLVNIGLGGQASAGAIPAQGGQQLSGLYSGLGQDLSQGMNQAAQARSGLYGQQQNMLQQFGTGLAEHTGQIGAARAAGTAASYTPVKEGNIFDTLMKGATLYSAFGGGGSMNLFGGKGGTGSLKGFTGGTAPYGAYSFMPNPLAYGPGY